MKPPKKYRVLTTFSLIGLILSAIWIGLLFDKNILSYFDQDWKRIAFFVVAEALILLIAFAFAICANRVLNEHHRQMADKWENEIKYRGIKPGDYTYVWFDGDLDYIRALIMPAEKGWLMYVQEYDDHRDIWSAVYDKELRFETLDELKMYLIKEFMFIFDDVSYDIKRREVFASPEAEKKYKKLSRLDRWVHGLFILLMITIGFVGIVFGAVTSDDLIILKIVPLLLAVGGLMLIYSLLIKKHLEAVKPKIVHEATMKQPLPELLKKALEEFKRSKLLSLFEFDPGITVEFAERDENALYFSIQRNGKEFRIDIDEEGLYMDVDGGVHNNTVSIADITDMGAIAELVKDFILANS